MRLQVRSNVRVTTEPRAETLARFRNARACRHGRKNLCFPRDRKSKLPLPLEPSISLASRVFLWAFLRLCWTARSLRHKFLVRAGTHLRSREPREIRYWPKLHRPRECPDWFRWHNWRTTHRHSRSSRVFWQSEIATSSACS